MSNLVWNYRDHQHQDRHQCHTPVKETRRRLEKADNLKDDQLEECQRECECGGKDELDAEMLDLIVLEQLLYEKHNAAAEE